MTQEHTTSLARAELYLKTEKREGQRKSNGWGGGGEKSKGPRGIEGPYLYHSVHLSQFPCKCMKKSRKFIYQQCDPHAVSAPCTGPAIIPPAHEGSSYQNSTARSVVASHVGSGVYGSCSCDGGGVSSLLLSQDRNPLLGGRALPERSLHAWLTALVRTS